MKGILAIILFSFCGLPGAFAQNIYQSLEGHVLVSGKYEGGTILAESHRLNLFLDYTTKEFRGKLDLGTLDTGIDSLNAKLAAMKPAQVLFSGVVPDDDFISWEHLELEFNIPLSVQLLGISLKPSLDIKLNHYKDSGTYACLLSGSMSLDLSAFENRPGGFGDTVEVKFTQVLMRRDR
ncbi:MAG: hypothetical protein H6577_26795 [Lewinellaceae bacterium]|nr:hypothetical protein [Saprospiraceae bacterium]MCB9341750.1 hypothetical protein [Lewinellaceae bacterium]